MSENTRVQNIGVFNCGFTGLLTITFITLKLCGVITWSWWWVLSPILVSIAVTLALLLIAGIALTAAGLLIMWFKK